MNFLRKFSITHPGTGAILLFALLSVSLYSGGSGIKGGRPGGGQGSDIRWFTMRGRDLSLQRGQIYYRPGRYRRSAVYRTYVLPRKQFFRYVKKWPVKGTVRLKIRIIGQRVRRSAGDPRGSRPMGGFRYITYFCSVIGGGSSRGTGGTSPAPGYPVGKRFILTIDPGSVKSHGLNDTMVYKPGRFRRSAVYYTYYFHKSSYYRLFGSSRRSQRIQAEVIFSKRKIQKVDPRLSQPIGGFHYYYIHVKLLRRVR